MARGERSERNETRIVDMRQWTMRHHPSVAAGGSGNKPPKTPKTTTGGPSDDDENGDPRGFVNMMDYLGKKIFPQTSNYRVDDQPRYMGQEGTISDLNPKNNPYIYKRDSRDSYYKRDPKDKK